MTCVKKYLVAAAAAATMMGLASVANADTYSFTITASPSGVQTGGFNHTIIGGAGPTNFNDQAQFTLTLPGNLDGQVSTILLGGVANVNFTSVYLDVVDLAHQFTIKVNPDGTDQAVLSSPILVGSGPHTLLINGQLIGDIGSYSGTVNVAPVPEPATWAMMILGMGMVGLGLRMRRRTASAVA